MFLAAYRQICRAQLAEDVCHDSNIRGMVDVVDGDPPLAGLPLFTFTPYRFSCLDTRSTGLQHDDEVTI
jgi:hypothetical protein